MSHALARLLSLVLLVLVAAPPAAGAQRRGGAPVPAPAAPAARVAPVMPGALVTRLVELGLPGALFPDVTRRAGLTGTNLTISSNRQQIARASAAAAASGAGAYAPPADLRRDEVTVTCVDTRQRFPIDCERVVVLVSERAVTPLRASNGPRTMTNDRGATWQIGAAQAVYSAPALKDGFVVTAIAGAGQTWTLIVTPEDAAERLLLTVATPAR